MQAIPSPRFALFHDAPAGADLYDVATWRHIRLSVFRPDPDDPIWVDVVGKRLADMRETWRILDAAPAPRRLVCICGAGLPTQMRIVVRDDRVYVPGEGKLAGIPPAAIGCAATFASSRPVWALRNATTLVISSGVSR